MALVLCAPHSAQGYGVYSHFELIDLAWGDSIRPLLILRYPGITEAQLTRAHSYAYGGCTIRISDIIRSPTISLAISRTISAPGTLSRSFCGMHPMPTSWHSPSARCRIT